MTNKEKFLKLVSEDDTQTLIEIKNRIKKRMEKTAVEWLFDNLKSHFKHDGDLFESVCMSYAIAKQKEKQQHSVTYGNALKDMINKKIDFEQYYNETFKKK